MLSVLFYYTLGVMFVYMMASATSLSAYFVSHRKSFLLLTLCFVFYFIDVSLVFKDDFITPTAILNASSFWDVGNPQATIISGAGMFLFLWLAICSYLGKVNHALITAPIAAYILASLIAFNAIGNVQAREFCFYSMREVLLFWMAGVIAYWYATGDEVLRAALRRHRVAYWVSLACTVGIVLENVYFQLIFDPSTLPNDMWFFSERNPMENMLFLTLAIMTMRAANETLRLRYDAPPEREDEAMEESIARVLPLYAKKNGLSKRERDVIRLIVMGKDNQNIASDLNLALSTVKVHVHNILKKTSQPDRHSLVRDFWSA